jgi:hypothetical protein
MQTDQIPLFDAQHDGDTYDPALDKDRLNKQLGRVYVVLAEGGWFTLAQVALYSNHLRSDGGRDSEASVSARIRDLRKDKFGGYRVDNRRVAGGLWEYRLRPRSP